MAKLPESSIRLQVDIDVEDRPVVQEFRPYLGISSLADSCARKLWYQFRFCAQEEITARKDRLFSRGHQEEPILIRELEAAGMRVHSTQLEAVAGNGHIKGHNDGIVENVPDAPKTPHLLEAKTGNDKNFKKTKKEGLIKAHPVYYGQMICYMHLFKLTRGLFIMTNKNDDDRYYERIYPDKELAKELLKRGEDIISTEVPPPKIGNATLWLCKWCKFSEICHFSEPVLKTCRSCQMLDICDNGRWECMRYGGLELVTKQQLKACDKYELLHTLR